MSNQHVIAPVAHIFAAGGPATVTRCVPLRVVDAVQVHPRWASRLLTHVSQEVWEVQPTIADGNPARAVVGVVRRLRISASLEHVGPNAVGGAPVAGAVVAMSKGVCRKQFAVDAATGLRIPSSERYSADDFLGAALATTKPAGNPFPNVGSTPNDGQAAEDAACEVDVVSGLGRLRMQVEPPFHAPWGGLFAQRRPSILPASRAVRCH